MANIKKLKENGSTIYPATIPEGVVDTNGFTLAEFMDELLEVLAGGGRGNMELAFSDLRQAIGSEDGNDLSRFVAKVNTFLNDADASDTTINRWKEIESFLAGITDTETLTGLLAENLQSAKSYADTKVSSGTANMVTMSANAGAADRVLISAGTNKTAKDSEVAISSLMKTDLSNVNSSTLENKLRGIGFQKTYLLEATYENGSFTSFNSSVTDVKSALHALADGEGTVLIHKNGSTDGDAAHVLSSKNTDSNMFDVWVVGSDGYLYNWTVNTSGSSATASGVSVNLLDVLTEVPVATTSKIGGVKSGGNITVGSDGTITVNQSTKATQDKNGADIAATYLKAAAVTDVTEYAEITI